VSADSADGRVTFRPEPVNHLVPPSRRGLLEVGPMRRHPEVTQLWLFGDQTSRTIPCSLILTAADIRRLIAVLRAQLPEARQP
jgi:hypothetical protein